MSPSNTQGWVRLVRKKLDDEGVREHLLDLAAAAGAVEVRIKGAGDVRSEQATLDLEDVADRVIRGDLAAVQIRYAIGDEWWIDTVMRVRGSYRLVRMREADQGT